MGRYDFAPQRVHKTVTRIIENGGPMLRPSWYYAVDMFPPTERLVRPALQSGGRRKGKSSRMFQPVRITYPEDNLRREFFEDHPWELARPRTILEDDGKDNQKYDWSQLVAPGRPVNGESVVQRQMWLMENEELTKSEAYDKARKEFYKVRWDQEIKRRIAKEEALHSGAYFGLAPTEIGSRMEDRAFEAWKVWAAGEIATKRQAQSSVYTGADADDEELDEIAGDPSGTESESSGTGDLRDKL